jgi:hypothetical protein
MKLRLIESDIKRWAEKCKYPLEENDLLSQKTLVQQAGCITQAQLGLVARWKAPRSAGHVNKNSENFVKEVSAFSFNTHDERARIESLTLLDGVEWPTASVILHFFHPDPYPIIDFRALWSVGLKVPKQYEFSFWWPYVEFCREAAARNGVDMRTLDRALWQYSKEKQK